MISSINFDLQLIYKQYFRYLSLIVCKGLNQNYFEWNGPKLYLISICYSNLRIHPIMLSMHSGCYNHLGIAESLSVLYFISNLFSNWLSLFNPTTTCIFTIPTFRNLWVIFTWRIRYSVLSILDSFSILILIFWYLFQFFFFFSLFLFHFNLFLKFL